nr:hypothetical protein [Chenggangzhangella methanolivorans]
MGRARPRAARLELIAPGTLLLWLGMAAIVVGGLALLFDPGWQIEVVGFAMLGLAAAVGWWFLGRPDNAASTDRPMLNRRAERHVGRVLRSKRRSSTARAASASTTRSGACRAPTCPRVRA